MTLLDLDLLRDDVFTRTYHGTASRRWLERTAARRRRAHGRDTQAVPRVVHRTSATSAAQRLSLEAACESSLTAESRREPRSPRPSGAA